jgi:hypothetical protein
VDPLDAIKLTLATKCCALHGRQPAIDIVNDEIKITTCCKEFHLECTEYITAVLVNNGLGYILTRDNPK